MVNLPWPKPWLNNQVVNEVVKIYGSNHAGYTMVNELVWFVSWLIYHGKIAMIRTTLVDLPWYFGYGWTMVY